jgi:hypothetical protein
LFALPTGRTRRGFFGSLDEPVGGRRMVKLLFVFSLCLLTYFYGIGTIFFQMPPYRTLVEAKLAFEAWKEVFEDENPHVAFVDKEGKPKPYLAKSESSEADNGYILMAGPVR